VVAALSGPDGAGARVSLASWAGVRRAEHGLDMPDPVACDVGRAYRHGGAVVLACCAGLAAGRALHDRQAWCPVGCFDARARGLFTAFDRVGQGAGEAAAVDRCGVGVEQGRESADVAGSLCLPEALDHNLGVTQWAG
jgi:hypothetical protein